MPYRWDSDEITWEEYHSHQRKKCYLEAVRFLNSIRASVWRNSSFLVKHMPKNNLMVITKMKNLCSEMEKYPVI